jgi:cation:H+ antiporter
VVGSNIFNILAVVGLTGLVAPEGVPVSIEALRFDIPVMIMVALARSLISLRLLSRNP